VRAQVKAINFIWDVHNLRACKVKGKIILKITKLIDSLY